VKIDQIIYGEINLERIVIGLVDPEKERREEKDVRSGQFLENEREFNFIVQLHVLRLEQVHVDHNK
jgi:hypothetical protein